jgi:hypothetical protein
MSETGAGDRALQDSVFLTKVARARQTPMAEKILDGPRLFDQSCEIMRGGIRSENPDFTSEQVEQELRRRLAMARRIDDAGLYRDARVVDE